MQGRENRHAGRGQIGMKVDAVKMHDIDGMAGQDLGDGRSKTRVGARSGRVVVDALRQRHRDERAFHPRPFAGDDDGTMAPLPERGIEPAEDLFSAADCVGAYGRQRIGDAEDRQTQSLKPPPEPSVLPPQGRASALRRGPSPGVS